MSIHLLLVGYVIVSRIVELLISRRNTRRLLAQGGYEVGGNHYPVIVALHVAWIVALAVLVPTETPPKIPFLIAFGLVQIARYWVIGSLGGRWTTRIIVVPGKVLVTRGPYRWFRHPNYLVVIAEIALLPLVFDAWEIALGFSIANAVIILYRIHIEEKALTMSIRVKRQDTA